MPLPEGYRPRKGDILVLHGVVKHDVHPGEESVFVTIDGHYGTESVKLDGIASLFARAWNKGERVRQNIMSTNTGDGEVVATYGDRVWVKFDVDGSMGTFRANDLVLIPSDDDPLNAHAVPPLVRFPASQENIEVPGTPLDEEVPL
jgi:hypothetical protein